MLATQKVCWCIVIVIWINEEALQESTSRQNSSGNLQSCQEHRQWRTQCEQRIRCWDIPSSWSWMDPRQLYCWIHTVLGMTKCYSWNDTEGMTKIWLRYQEKIEYDNMYQSITGFELDMEDKSLIKQILECFLRITADPLGERSWSRFAAYCKFVKDLAKLNFGQELHGNRFDDFEKC